MSRELAPDLWRRYLGLLRATGRPPLPAPPPSAAELPAILRQGKT